MDAIRGVVLSEGAKEKTSDGMTKDARHFAQDLHKVTDVGVKHMVQKDSETKDYERMFSGGVDKAPTRLADIEPSQAVDKYVEYNEAVKEEKKRKKDDDKSEKKKKDQSENESDDSDAEDNTGPMEAVVAPQGALDASRNAAQAARKPYTSPVTPGGAAGGLAAGTRNFRGYAAPPTRVVPSGTPPVPSPMAGQGTASLPKSPMASQGAASAAKSPMASQGTASLPKSPMASQGAASAAKSPMASQSSSALPKSPMASQGTSYSPAVKRVQPGQPGSVAGAVKRVQPGQPGAVAKAVTPTGNPNMAGSGGNVAAAKAKVAGGQPKPKIAATAGIATRTKAQVAKPQAARPAAKPQGSPASRLQSKFQRDSGVGPKSLSSSFEIDINGTSYFVSEAHASAIAAFVEKHGLIEGTAGEFIHKEMEHPEKLTAKGKKQKIKQSLAIYYSKKRRGENP